MPGARVRARSLAANLGCLLARCRGLIYFLFVGAELIHSYCKADCVTLIAQKAAVFAAPYVQDGAELEPAAVLCEAK